MAEHGSKREDNRAWDRSPLWMIETGGVAYFLAGRNGLAGGGHGQKDQK